ncbi:DUF6049 family protein [Trujillonella endophytica]|uniref:Glycoprotein n=1 Tax=Trujillonella endophytica TaxID=673521 RepID=A0A1H8VA68_9ACTN|nr:DUF6049 family protein [Trujillella endophytica]SEP12309.1 hypothetical protein SAMN05660991_03384 [Trujillella endophytica]
MRVLLAALLALPLLAGLAGLAPSPAGAAPGDGETDADRPVRIEIDRMDPATVAPGGPITLSGTLTNTGDEDLTGLSIRLQRGEVLRTRAELVATDTDPDPAATVAAAFKPIADPLPAGESIPFDYTTTTTDLQLGEDGVYPVLLNLNGAGEDGEQRRVGEVSTFVVQASAPPIRTTGVAWLWPLVEPTHRDAAGRFVDDELADLVASGGRLDRALAAVERIPETAPPGAAPQPVARVTLAIDPALVEALTVMADGPYAIAGSSDGGDGTEAAAAFLERLRAVAADHPVVALPYGDVDVDALTTAGLAAVAARSLPATGTAAAFPAVPEEGAPPVDQRGAGVRILRDALGVPVRSDLMWAAGGTVHGQTLGVLRDGGVSTVVVGSTSLTDGAAAVGLESDAAAARTPLADGTTGLVADSGLSGLAGSAGSVAAGTRIAGQRYVAELTLLAGQPGGDPLAPRTVLVAPARGVDADADGMAAMIASTALVPGVRTASLDELLTGPVADTGGLTPPSDPVAIDPAVLADVQAAVGVRDDLAGAVVGDPAAALAPYDAATARATSVAWRADPDRARAAAADLRRTLDGLLDEVTLLSPADGTYSLASSDAPLVLTVRNDLEFAVQVRLQVRARGGVGLSVEDIGVQLLAPGERTTLQVPAEVGQSGRFTVTARLVTPDGGELGSPVELQVTSTAYGAISLAITIGAAALLGLLFLRRLVLFLLRRRAAAARGEAEDDQLLAPEGAAVPLPPTRSPV